MYSLVTIGTVCSLLPVLCDTMFPTHVLIVEVSVCVCVCLSLSLCVLVCLKNEKLSQKRVDRECAHYATTVYRLKHIVYRLHRSCGVVNSRITSFFGVWFYFIFCVSTPLPASSFSPMQRSLSWDLIHKWRLNGVQGWCSVNSNMAVETDRHSKEGAGR